MIWKLLRHYWYFVWGTQPFRRFPITKEPYWGTLCCFAVVIICPSTNSWFMVIETLWRACGFTVIMICVAVILDNVCMFFVNYNYVNICDNMQTYWFSNLDNCSLWSVKNSTENHIQKQPRSEMLIALNINNLLMPFGSKSWSQIYLDWFTLTCRYS